MTELLKPDRRIRELILPDIPERFVTYIPSQFVIPVKWGEESCLLNTLTRQCIRAELPASAQAGDGYDELIKSRFLVPEGMDESGFYTYVFSLMQMTEPGKKEAGYTILPTLACNARCVYCYEAGRPQITMSAETQARVIHYILHSRGERPVKLGWFGGEPLLCTDIIDRICSGLKEAEVPYRSSMITNGSLINAEIIEKMTGLWRLKRIQVSMDGAEEDYRERKRYLHYDRIYQCVLESVSLMSRAGIEVTVRCNVDQDNIDRIPEFLEDMKKSVRDKQRVSVHLAPLNAVRESEGAIPLLDRLPALKRGIADMGFRPSGTRILSPRFRTGHCMADQGGVVITPDGSLYPCEHCPPEARFGDVWGGVTDEAARTAFSRMDRVREKCRDCPYLPLCTAFQSCPVQEWDCRAVMRREVDAFFSGLPDPV